MFCCFVVDNGEFINFCFKKSKELVFFTKKAKELSITENQIKIMDNL
jgi:hypothetical protein